ncbi:short-chain dehydrogenase [Pseudoalteromonas mariniglutinosa]|uniref:short-chain dehydrogenase n=1 Tax=Pseudoalteromonas mariniglutinosa TaxID=206042 RepID=UPI00384DD23A
MRAILASIGLLVMSFSSLAKDITETELQNYIKALPAVINWSEEQPALQSLDLGSALTSESQGQETVGVVALLKDNDLYKQFAELTNQYGFTPEQLITVGSDVSMAYFENIKAGLSTENQQKVNQLMGGLQGLGSAKESSTTSLMGALGNSTAASEQPIVSEQNLSLVKQYMPQLEKLFTMLK